MTTPAQPSSPTVYRIDQRPVEFIAGKTWTWCKLTPFSWPDGWRRMDNAKDFCPSCLWWTHSDTRPTLNPEEAEVTDREGSATVREVVEDQLNHWYGKPFGSVQAQDRDMFTERLLAALQPYLAQHCDTQPGEDGVLLEFLESLTERGGFQVGVNVDGATVFDSLAGSFIGNDLKDAIRAAMKGTQ